MGDRICPNCGEEDLVVKGLEMWKCLSCGEEYEGEYLDLDIEIED
ncbi:YgiT-type zinc finger protein [Ectobacillus polymachus]